MDERFKLIPFPRLAPDAGKPGLDEVWLCLDEIADAAARGSRAVGASTIDPKIKLEIVDRMRSLVVETCSICILLADHIGAPDELKDRLNQISNELEKA